MRFWDSSFHAPSTTPFIICTTRWAVRSSKPCRISCWGSYTGLPNRSSIRAMNVGSTYTPWFTMDALALTNSRRVSCATPKAIDGTLGMSLSMPNAWAKSITRLVP